MLQKVEYAGTSQWLIKKRYSGTTYKGRRKGRCYMHTRDRPVHMHTLASTLTPITTRTFTRTCIPTSLPTQTFARCTWSSRRRRMSSTECRGPTCLRCRQRCSSPAGSSSVVCHMCFVGLFVVGFCRDAYNCDDMRDLTAWVPEQAFRSMRTHGNMRMFRIFLFFVLLYLLSPRLNFAQRVFALGRASCHTI